MVTSKSSNLKKLSSKKIPVVKNKRKYRKTNYETRPLWQWIVIYTLIGIIVYGFIYYMVVYPKGGATYKSPKSTTTQDSLKFQ